MIKIVDKTIKMGLTISFILLQHLNIYAQNQPIKIERILAKMTLEEKVGQMTQITVTNFEDTKKPGYFDAAKLKQGIQDGFLAPYKVVRIDIDKDIAEIVENSAF